MLNINAFRLVVHGKKIFQDLSKCFPYFALLGICDPGDFICTNLNLLVLRMHHAKYQHIQASGS